MLEGFFKHVLIAHQGVVLRGMLLCASGARVPLLPLLLCPATVCSHHCSYPPLALEPLVTRSLLCRMGLWGD